VDSRPSLDDVEKRKFLTLLGLKLRPLGCPACSQSLYQLRYPGSKYEPYELLNNLNILFPVPSFIFHIFHTFITMKATGQDPIYLFPVY
jgi:hypothetical protein